LAGSNRVHRGVKLLLGSLAVLVLTYITYRLYATILPKLVALAIGVSAAASYISREPTPAYVLAAIGLATLLAAGGDVHYAALMAAVIVVLAVIRGYIWWKPPREKLKDSEGRLRLILFEASTFTILVASSLAAAAAIIALIHYKPSMLPYPLSTILDIASGSIIVRITGIAAIALLIYYIIARLASPIVFAVMAGREQLKETIERLITSEANALSEWKTWYHRLLYTALSTAGGVAGSALLYFASSQAIKALLELKELPIPSMALLWAASLLAGYLGALLTVNMLRGPGDYWRKLAITGLALLASYILALTVFAGEPLGEALRLLYAPLVGAHPVVQSDLKLAPYLLKFELELRQSFSEIEYIARFIVKLLWG
jgi:hypothetical protein